MIKKIINLIIYILRYYSIINTKYKVSTQINFGSSLSNNFFQKKLRKCKFYLEYGAGNTTLLANKINKKYISLETDKSFFNYLKYKKKINNLKYIDIGPTKYISYPILPHFLIQKKIIFYCNYIESFFNKTKNTPDLILVDGRFRANTCLHILSFLSKKKIKDKTTIIIDDYVNRKNYQILEKILNVRKIGRLGVIEYNHYKRFSKRKIEDLIHRSKKDFI